MTYCVFFFSSRRRHTRCALVTGVQTCALPISVKRSYDDWLPATNLNLYPADNLILRGAIAKVMTRPGLGSLTPGGSVDQFNFRITSGKPVLDPYRATTYDVALEWYFEPGALASLALFSKEIIRFQLRQSRADTFA